MIVSMFYPLPQTVFLRVCRRKENSKDLRSAQSNFAFSLPLAKNCQYGYYEYQPMCCGLPALYQRFSFVEAALCQSHSFPPGTVMIHNMQSGLYHMKKRAKTGAFGLSLVLYFVMMNLYRESRNIAHADVFRRLLFAGVFFNFGVI